METSISIWFSVAALMVVLIIVRILRATRHKSASGHNLRHFRMHNIFVVGSEREELWVPGDKIISYTHNKSEDDDCDL